VEFQLIELVIKSIDKMDEAIWKCMTCGEKFLEFEAVGKHRKSQHYGNQYKNKRRRAESQKESSEETKEEMNVDATPYETIYDSDSDLGSELSYPDESILLPLNEMFTSTVITTGENWKSAYMCKQEKLYKITYGIDTICASNIDQFLAFRTQATPTLNETFFDELQIYIKLRLQVLGKTSNKDNEIIVSLIKSFADKSCRPIKTWRTIKENIESYSSMLEYRKHTVEWPKSWKMGTMRIPMPSPVIRALDLVEYLAYKFVDPLFMFPHESELRFESSRVEKVDDHGVHTRVYGDIMTGNWAMETERSIRERTGNHKAILIPIILYWDGVNLTKTGSRSSLTALGKIGNCSLELLNREDSKILIGYATELENESITEIMAHLVSIFGNKTAAKAQLKYFEWELERKFWLLATSSVNKIWEEGTRIHILGQGVKTIHVAFPFVSGDYPALKRIANMTETVKANFPCISCLYPSNCRDIYDPKIHPFRDASKIKRVRENAEIAFVQKRQGKTYNRKNLERDQLQSCHPIRNFLDYCPMGSQNNSVYDSRGDILHTLAGLMKDATLLILDIIVLCDDSLSRRKQSLAFLNQSFRSFTELKIPDMPHLHWTTFKNLTDITNKDSKSVDGRKTNDFISALLQIFIVLLGTTDEILPEGPRFELHKPRHAQPVVISENIKILALTVSITMCDVYFDSKRTEWTEVAIQEFESKIINMTAHLKKLMWIKKRLNLGADVELNDFSSYYIKPHSLRHWPASIVKFGALTSSDTASDESAHKTLTKLIYNLTSKRKDAQCKEMIIRAKSWYFCKNFLGTYRGLLLKGKPYFDENSHVIDRTYDWNVSTVATKTMSFNPTELDPTFEELDPYIFDFKSFDFKQFKEQIEENARLDFCEENNEKLVFSFLKRIKITSSNITNHGTYILDSLKSYVLIKISGESSLNQVARILAITKCTLSPSTSYYITVRYLKECDGKRMYIPGCIPNIRRLQWELIYRDKTRALYYETETVSMNTIIGPAFVVEVPVMSPSSKNVSKSTQRFVFIERMFFDRSCWETTTEKMNHDNKVSTSSTSSSTTTGDFVGDLQSYRRFMTKGYNVDETLGNDHILDNIGGDVDVDEEEMYCYY